MPTPATKPRVVSGVSESDFINDGTTHSVSESDFQGGQPAGTDWRALWDIVKKQAWESSPFAQFKRENVAPAVAAAAAAAAPETGGLTGMMIPAILAGMGGAAGEGVGQMADAVSARKAVDLPAAAQAMGTEGAIQAANEFGGRTIAKGAQGLARPVYQWALRPYAGLRKNFGLDTLIETGLNERIPVTKRGTLKAERLRSASGAEAQQLIAAADKAGAPPVKVSEIDKGLQGVRDTMATDVRLGSSDESQALAARVKAMETANPQDISLTDAQVLKQRAQDRADKAYRAERAGTPLSTSLETEEAIASSLRQAIENRFPQVKGQSQIKTVNERTRGLIGLHRALGDAEGRTSVLGTLLAISGAIGGGGGGFVSGHPLLGATVAAPLAMKLMTSPGVLSHGAIMANELVTPGAVSSILRAFGGKDGFRQWYQQELAKRAGQQEATAAVTIVFRNRLDNDNGRQIFEPLPPVQTIDTVAEIKAALLVPGSYEIASGLYIADFIAVTDNVSMHCAPGVIFRTTAFANVAWTIMANNFSLTGEYQVDCGGQLGMGIGDNTVTTQAQQPDNVLIEGGTFLPFYVNLGTGTKGTATRAIAAHASNVTIHNCRIEGFWREGQDNQCIWVNNTNGPITVTDCFLEAAGENILFAGDGILIPNAVPSDCYIARNTFYKRPSWENATPVRDVKNLFEIKNGQRFIIEDNVFDRCWKGAQNGDAIALTVRNSGQALHPSTPSLWNPWVICDAITFDHNIFRNITEPGAFVFTILGHDDEGRDSQQTRTITIINNLFEDADGGFQLNNGVTDLFLIDHNTIAADTVANILQFANVTIKSVIQMTNNAMQQGVYGVFASGVSGVAITALNAGCSAYTITGNLFGRNQSQGVTWPSGNTVVGPAGTGLVFTAPPECALTGAQAGANAGWSGPAGVGLNGDGTTSGGQP